MTKNRASMAAAALLAVMAVNLLTVVARKSITVDETLAIPAGYYYLTARAFDIHSDHPPLPKMLAALPLLWVPVAAPALEGRGKEPSQLETLVATTRFWTANRDHFRSIFFWARVPMIVLTVLLGILVFMVTRRLFTARAAVLAVTLFSLDPTMLAHGRVIKDVPVAFAYLLFCFALYVYLSAPTPRRAALLGLACGMAVVMKYSMVIVLPVLLLAGGALVLFPPGRVARRRIAAQVAIAVLVTGLTLNAAYLFSRQPLSEPDSRSVAAMAPAVGRALTQSRLVSTIAPPYFWLGALTSVIHHDAGHPGFLLGEYRTRGWWYYFPVAFALKTTLPFLLLTVGALGWAAWRAARRDAKYVLVLTGLAMYAVPALSASVNIGIRHFLPAFPFLFILGGAQLDCLLGAHRARWLARALVIVVIAGCGVETVRAYPDYIPYVNQLASGQPPWAYLSDSNIEWGDDAGALAAYLRARGETRVRGALLGGDVTLPLYGVELVDLLSPPGTPLAETRYVALGASFLNGSTVPGWSEGSGRETPEQRHEFFAGYRGRRPEAVFGKSIYLYRANE